MYIPRYGYTAEQALKGARLADPKFTRNGVTTFRNTLVQYGLCEPHELMTIEHIATLKEAIRSKQENETWENCFTRTILARHMGEIPAEDYFSWTKKQLLEYLINGVETKALTVNSMDHINDPVEMLFISTAIDNFVELGKSIALFEGTRGTDYNGFCFEITAPNGDTYYTLGLLNHKADRVDMHLFGCQGGRFSPLSTKYYGIFPWETNSRVHHLCQVCGRAAWEREHPDGDYDDYLKQLETGHERFTLEKFRAATASAEALGLDEVQAT